MLREKTQRRLCRLLFLVACVAPTVAIAGWVGVRSQAGYAESVLAEASRRLGVRVACDRLRTPRPDQYELLAVRLADAGTGAPLGGCDTLRLQRVDGGWRFRAGALRLEGPGSLRGLATWLDGAPSVRGEIDSLAIESTGGDPFTLARLRCVLATQEKTATLRVESEEGAVATLTRRLDRSAPATRLVVESAETPVPCELLPCPLLDGAAGFVATFRGRFESSLTSDRYADAGAATGTVRLAPRDASDAAWSTGSCRLREAAWSGDRLERFEGRLELRDGELSRAVVLGMNHSLDCNSFAALQRMFGSGDSDSPIPFTQLACDVEIDGRGITLVAGCGEIDGERRGGAVAHALLEHRGEPLLREPTTRPLPAASLVRALWHGAPAELPASEAAQAVARRLPTRAEPSTR